MHSGSDVGQGMLQPPQFAGTETLVSQPSSGFEVQCAWPLVQALVASHTPDEQRTSAPCTLGSLVQSWPQLPQLRGSSCTSAPQPPSPPPARSPLTARSSPPISSPGLSRVQPASKSAITT